MEIDNMSTETIKEYVKEREQKKKDEELKLEVFDPESTTDVWKKSHSYKTLKELEEAQEVIELERGNDRYRYFWNDEALLYRVEEE